MNVEAAKQVMESFSLFTNKQCESTASRLQSDVERYINCFPKRMSHLGDPTNDEIDEFLYGKLLQKLLQFVTDKDPMAQESICYILLQKLMIVDGATFPMLNELFLALDDALKSQQNVPAASVISKLWGDVIKSDVLQSAIINISTSKSRNAIAETELEERWRNFLQILVSLPNKVANKLAGKVPDIFTLDLFTKTISYHIIKVINFLNDLINENDIKVNSSFVSQLISKVLVVFGAQHFSELVKIIVKLSLTSNTNSQRLIQKIFHKLKRSSIAPAILLLLKTAKDPNEMEKILGDVLSVPEWRYTLTNKIPLLSFYDDDQLIINLVSYLSITYNVLVDLSTRLLDIWGDQSALTHTSINQHEYLTKLILIAMIKLKDSIKSSDRDSVRQLLYAGVFVHLQSLDVEIRAMGMITGQLVVPLLNTSEDEPVMKFDFEDIPENGKRMVKKLEGFFLIGKQHRFDDCDVGTRSAGEMIEDLGVQCGILEGEHLGPVNRNVVAEQIIQEDKLRDKQKVERKSKDVPEVDSDDLDSDDDLVPFDMSSDTQKAKSFASKYLRDLKENLTNFEPEKKDVEIFVESVENAEQLILSQLSNDDASFAVELLQIFLHLDEKVFVKDFNDHKFRCCVAIVAIYPKECAQYLGTEFHAKISNYSINDRLFMLQVLSEAARRLSKLKLEVDEHPAKDSKVLARRVTKPISLQVDIKVGKTRETLYDEDFDFGKSEVDPDSFQWQEIIERRLQSKTRHFAHQPKRPKMSRNKFNESISHFFYPLVYGFNSKQIHVQLPESYSDQQCILLSEFLRTLSVIVMAGENCTNISKIALIVLELVWSLRFHEQATIRYQVLQNILAVVVTVHEQEIPPEMVEILMELKDWLIDVSQHINCDPDPNCRALAKQLLTLF